MSRPTAEVMSGGRVHSVGGAQAAIIRDGRVLVQLRPWPPGWELPGGHLAPGESAAECALREAREETGLEVRMVGLAGVYRWAGLRRTADAVFVVEPVGGHWRRGLEALAMRWVAPGELPVTIFPWYPDRIRDALAVHAGAAAAVRTQPVTMRNVLFFGTRWPALGVDALRSVARRARARAHARRR